MLLEYINTMRSLYRMVLPIAAAHAVYRRRLIVPVLVASLEPTLAILYAIAVEFFLVWMCAIFTRWRIGYTRLGIKLAAL